MQTVTEARTQIVEAAVDGAIRKLLPSETELFRRHLLRLDKDSRRMRFAHGVSDSFIDDYAMRMSDSGAIVFGYVVDGEVHAAAELRKLGDVWGQQAEAAFSVEFTYQDRGVGGLLMGRVIRAARNRGLKQLYMSCLADNRKMQAIAQRHEAHLKFEYGEVIGEIVPGTADYFSLWAEAMEDRAGYMLAVLDLQARVRKAA